MLALKIAAPIRERRPGLVRRSRGPWAKRTACSTERPFYGSTGSTQLVVPPPMLVVADLAVAAEAPQATSSPPVLPVTFAGSRKNAEDSSLRSTPPPVLPVMTTAPANLTVELRFRMIPWSPFPVTLHPLQLSV
jgi:hypothetical protein